MLCPRTIFASRIRTIFRMSLLVKFVVGELLSIFLERKSSNPLSLMHHFDVAELFNISSFDL